MAHQGMGRKGFLIMICDVRGTNQIFKILGYKIKIISNFHGVICNLDFFLIDNILSFKANYVFFF